MFTSRKPSDADKRQTKDLAERRRSLKVTQSGLAEQLGISAQQLGKYERGENRMPAGRLSDANRYLGSLDGGDGRRGFAEAAVQGYVPAAAHDPREELFRALDEARAAFNRADEAARRLRV